MFKHNHAHYFHSLIVCFVVLLCLTTGAQARAKRKIFIPGQHALVIDERFSAFRERPDVKAPLKQRLRRGRVVGILGSVKKKSGARFLYVAISRNVRGYMHAAALARLGDRSDAEKLVNLLTETPDDLLKIKLARLCADNFRGTPAAPRCLVALGKAAEHAAEKLARDAQRRLGVKTEAGNGADNLLRRDLMLNFAGLDRFNRAGVTFDYLKTVDRIVYDGAVYRELLRRYPRSAEAREARERLEILAEQ
jgi:hypothetical protein